MKVKFNNQEYKRNGRNGRALKNLCFDIFKQYISEHTNLIYPDIQKIFNNRHGTNNYVVLNQEDWEEKTVDVKNRYFEPIKYNNEKLYFTTQWGNNGGESDNINHMINFAQEQGYDIAILENNNMETNNNIFYGLWLARDKNPQEVIDSGIWINNLSNESRIEKQLNKLQIGDEVFLYQSEKDLKTKNTPFANYLTEPYKFMKDKTIVEVTSWAVGQVKNINVDNRKVEIDWDKNYTDRKWYVFYRQDGIWELDLNTSNTLRRLKYKALYDIVFKGKEQDYKWWIDNKIFDRYKNNNFSKNINSINTKNIILYGSPGVGKTHNTNKLISLIEEGKSDREIFETIKKNENSDSVDISDIKERVKFVTFHQSFGYEDFIEGFRPNEEGDIELEKGIFLEICKDAQKNLDNSLKAPIDIGVEKKFKVLFELFKDNIQDEIDIKQKFIINDTAYITNIEENAFRYQGDNWGNTQRMKFDDIELLYSKNISERKDIKTVDGISGLAKQHATYFSYFMKKLLDFENNENIQIDTVEKIERQNYYLVIDEINRGNISKIFGELITLIEEDKRDTLEVTLPYSKEPFRIPSNLYIIGTMNSTDKSIALIDIALRRRFTFLKMKPNAELIIFDKAKEIFIALNEQITKDLGEDYQIGHSYFMRIADEDELDFVLDYKIIPLLEEYYYGDDRFDEIVKLCKPDRGDN